MAEPIRRTRTVREFNDWIVNAIPGDSFDYHTGPFCSLPSNVSRCVLKAYHGGWIEIFHKRVGTWTDAGGKQRGVFTQIATRIGPKTKVALDRFNFGHETRQSVELSRLEDMRLSRKEIADGF